jgi:WD40 repeat protein
VTGSRRYNTRVERAIRRGLVTFAAVLAALVPLSSAGGGAFPGGNGPIAYGCGADICRINADGTAKTTLLTTASDPSWDADETQIAYVDAGVGVSVANQDGSGGASLFAGLTSVQPSFSLDGFRVAYSKGTPGDIFTIQSNTGGGEQPLTNTPGVDDVEPAYSPDGSMIAFASNSAGTYDIWTLDLTSFALTRITTVNPGDERSPTWSPSGSTIVFSSGGQLYSVASSGGSVTALNVAGTDPAYSPDGTKIAFVNGAGNLAVMAASVGGAVTVMDNTAGNADPDWQALAAPPPSFSGPPHNVAYPTINLASGDASPVVGHLLTASVGTWDGSFPITYKYQWKRCEASDPVNGPCVDISAATSSFYTPTAADVGSRLRVAVTATNSQGTATQNSEVSAVVIAIAPKVRSTPQIVGDNIVDQTLTLTPGAWDGSTPLAFTYSWRRCNPVGDLASCVQIPGATGASYSPTVPDIGFSIRVWITGANVVGSDVAITNHTFPIVDKQHFAPSATKPPTVAGTALPGRQLTANIGTYGGDAPIGTSFTWQRCDATGADCRVIAGAKKVVYFPTFADIGFTIRLVVVATNAYGRTVVQSDRTDTVAGTPPHLKGRRIVGTAKGEYLAGGGHDDVILGLGGNDTLPGGAGDDRIEGGAGNDVITGGGGADRLFGGPGSDTINAADGERDVIDCGSGRDRASADSFDVVKNCEVVDTPPASSGGSPSSG